MQCPPSHLASPSSIRYQSLESLALIGGDISGTSVSCTYWPGSLEECILNIRPDETMIVNEEDLNEPAYSLVPGRRRVPPRGHRKADQALLCLSQEQREPRAGDVRALPQREVSTNRRGLLSLGEGRAADLAIPHVAGNRGQTPRCSAREAGGPRYRCRRIAWNSSSASLLTAAMTVSPGMSTVLPLIISSPSSSSTAMSCTSLLKGMFATWMPSR